LARFGRVFTAPVPAGAGVGRASAELSFQVLRRTISTLAQKEGGIKDVQGVRGYSRSRHHGCGLRSGDRGEREPDAPCDLPGVDRKARVGIVNRKNLVRFATVGSLVGPQVVDLESVGA